MIKIKVKAGENEFLVEGSAEALTFSLDGKTVGQGRVGNDGRATCTKGVDMVFTARLNPTQDIKVTIKEMVRSLSLAITEERQWSEGKPVNVALTKVWAEDGELRVSRPNGETMDEFQLIEYLKSFLPKHLFAEPNTGSATQTVEDDFESDELPEWAEQEPPTEPESTEPVFAAPTSLLTQLKKRD